MQKPTLRIEKATRVPDCTAHVGAEIRPRASTRLVFEHYLWNFLRFKKSKTSVSKRFI